MAFCSTKVYIKINQPEVEAIFREVYIYIYKYIYIYILYIYILYMYVYIIRLILENITSLLA